MRQPAINRFKCLRPLQGDRAAVAVLSGPLETPCWIWLGGCNDRGYGSRGTNGEFPERYLVHRRVYEEFNGPIPDSHQIHHLCERPRCVNPTHLEVLSSSAHTRRHLANPAAAERLALHLAGREPLRLIDIVRETGLKHSTVNAALRRGIAHGEFKRVEPKRWTVLTDRKPS